MTGEDAELALIRYLIEKGRTLDDILSMNEYERLVYFAAMEASAEIEAAKWGAE